jgi:hypothetical protein
MNIRTSLIVCCIVTALAHAGSTWRERLNVDYLRNYISSLYGGTGQERLQQRYYDACVDFVTEFIDSTMDNFRPDEQATLIKLKKLMLDKLYQDAAKRAARLAEIGGHTVTSRK